MAQILQIQKKNDDLGSSGTKTPDTVPEMSNSENNQSAGCMENVAKEENIEKESNDSNTHDVDMIENVSIPIVSIGSRQVRITTRQG